MNMMDAAPLSVEPIVGALRVSGGASLDADLCTAALPAPPRVARGRENEHIFLLLDLSGPASSHLYRELRQVAAQTYWSTAGSVTAALRQAAAAASRHLFRANLHSVPSARCYGGLACAAWHNDDLFIVQAGPVQPCTLHRGTLERLCDQELPHLGARLVTDVRLYHTLVSTGDALLLASAALLRGTDDAALARVLNRPEIQEVSAGLEQIGAGTDFSALVVHWAASPSAPGAKAPAILDAVTKRHPIERREPPPPTPEPRPRPARRTGPRLSKRVGRALGKIGRGAGRGILGGGAWLVNSAGALFRRMLPGPERKARRRARVPRPIPRENRVLMMGIAVAIPALIAVTVALAYNSFGKEARFQRLLEKARLEIALAEEAGGVSEETRGYWETALRYTSDAAAWQPDDPDVVALQAQAQAALDVLNGIVRLKPIKLWDFGPSAAPHRLIVHGQTIFVLDPAESWVAQLTLNQLGNGVIEQDNAPILVHAGQQVEGKKVGQLVDMTWMNGGGERQTSDLVILENGKALLDYDPAWGDAEGGVNLTRSLLGTPPGEGARIIASFEGRLYILDGADNQIWRYNPQGNLYPDQPDPYFLTAAPKPLEDALDMAIDGNIYILYADGTILKFLQREPQPFEVRGVPGEIGQATAFAVDEDSRSGMVYLADRDGGRIIVLNPDGSFHAQLCAPDIFDDLQALAVDETAGRLYIINGGRLYVASF